MRTSQSLLFCTCMILFPKLFAYKYSELLPGKMRHHWDRLCSILSLGPRGKTQLGNSLPTKVGYAYLQPLGHLSHIWAISHESLLSKTQAWKHTFPISLLKLEPGSSNQTWNESISRGIKKQVPCRIHFLIRVATLATRPWDPSYEVLTSQVQFEMPVSYGSHREIFSGPEATVSRHAVSKPDSLVLPMFLRAM